MDHLLLFEICERCQQHITCFLGLHRTADDEQDGRVQDESKTKSNVGEKGDNYNTKRKKKGKKKEISPAPLNMKIPFITF